MPGSRCASKPKRIRDSLPLHLMRCERIDSPFAKLVRGPPTRFCASGSVPPIPRTDHLPPHSLGTLPPDLQPPLSFCNQPASCITPQPVISPPHPSPGCTCTIPNKFPTTIPCCFCPFPAGCDTPAVCCERILPLFWQPCCGFCCLFMRPSRHTRYNHQHKEHWVDKRKQVGGDVGGRRSSAGRQPSMGRRAESRGQRSPALCLGGGWRPLQAAQLDVGGSRSVFGGKSVCQPWTPANKQR